MPFSLQKSGLFVPIGPAASSLQKFSCKYVLDDRIDAELAQVCWDLWHSIQPALGDKAKIRVTIHQGAAREAFPDPVHLWMLYCASLISGAADAALTLAIHNLGREARVMARQLFEYTFKAQYFAKHRREAKREIETEPFRELWLLEDLGYDRRAARYVRLKKECAELAKKRPALYAYAKKTRRKEQPTVPASMGRVSRRRRETYTLHYRVRSQSIHAGVLGMRDVITNNGIQFDSRESDPNYTLLDVSRYLIAFLRILDRTLSLGKKGEIDKLFQRVAKLEDRLLSHLKRSEVANSK